MESLLKSRIYDYASSVNEDAFSVILLKCVNGENNECWRVLRVFIRAQLTNKTMMRQKAAKNADYYGDFR